MKSLHLMLAILPVWGAIATYPCAAQSIVPADDGTGTLVNSNGNLINISGGSFSQDQTNLFHSFSQFGLNQNQIANFLSNPSIQNILARVVGGDASVINGLIRVSGGNSNLYLINPAGIIFGAGARLNVPASLMATTATGVSFGDKWLSAAGGNDYVPLVGNPNTFAFTTGQPGAIANFGNLAVGAGSSITLLGGTVLNAGQLSAAGGQVILTAVPGETLVRLSQAGTVLSLEFQPLAASSTQPQPWTLPVASLPQLLTGGGVDGANQVQVNPDGTIQLTGSDISIPTNTGTVIASGTIDVSTFDPPLTPPSKGGEPEPESEPPFLSGKGGIVNVLGDRVGLFNANINASGINGGGTVLIGGDYQGKGSVPHALRTFVSNDSVIKADAQLSGTGGKVIVWADEVTRFYGTTQVRGGNLSGNGGIVEVSGKGSLVFQGTADTTALQGNMGTLLLDPTDIVIREGVGDGNDLDGSNLGFTGSPFGGVGQVLANDTTPTVLFESEIAGLARNNNVVLEATNNITIENLSDDFFGVNPLQSPTSILRGSLTFRAGNSLSMNPGDTILTQGGISISAANITTGKLAAGQGITLNATGNIATTDLASFAAINVTAGGSISTNRLLTGGDINIAGVTLSLGTSNASNITLTSNGNIVTGGINASSKQGDGGNVTLSSAAGTILIDPSRGESTLIINGDPLNATGAVFSVAQESGRGGTIRLQANGYITTGAIASGSLRGDGGEINLISTTGAIDTTQGEIRYRGDTIPDTGLLLSGSGGNGTGGKITVTASGNIITGPVVSASREGDGGEINLTSTSGNIDTLQGLTSLQAFEALLEGADISSSNLSPQTSSSLFPLARIVAGSIVSGSGDDGIGGKISVSAGGNLSTGGVISTSIDGNGGAINLATTKGDIDVFLINSQSLGAGRGGNVDVNASRFFRATGTAQTALDQLPPDAVNPSDIPARLDRQASLSSAGDGGGGSITIRHGGGDSSIPFFVGNTRFNGTAGSITTRSTNTISPKRDFWGSYTQDNIRIITSEQGQINPEFPPIPEQLPLQAQVAKKQTATVTIEEAREILRPIQEATGVKPGLIYVSFVPAAVSQSFDLANREQLFTQEFDRHLTTPSVVVESKISLEPQDSDELELLLVTAEGKPIRKRLAGVTRDRVLAVADQFRTEITLNQSDDYLPPAQQLYQWLIAPLEAEFQVRGIENLVFIMDAELRSIPMAALHDGQKFLIERYSVGLMPSLSLADTRYQSARNAQILAMGASKFSDPKLNPLYAVPEEVQTIVSEWPRQGKYFLDQDFTFENLKGQRTEQPFGIIHLATHAVFQSGALSNSFIQLGNRRLGLNELRQLGWNNPPVELLVLSACQTVLGDQDAELGFAGLAHQAGVKSALASLWYVDDRATLALMTEFYRQLGKVSTKAEALRQAQLALLRGQIRVEAGELRTVRGTMPLPPELGKRGQVNFSNPASWAAFTLVGSPW